MKLAQRHLVPHSGHYSELVAQLGSTVLLTGETGTGKDLVARAIHDRSRQRHLPLIKV